MFGARKVTPDAAPIEASIKIWPAAMKGRVTVVRDGKTHDLDLALPYVRFLLSFLAGIR